MTVNETVFNAIINAVQTLEIQDERETAGECTVKDTKSRVGLSIISTVATKGGLLELKCSFNRACLDLWRA